LKTPYILHLGILAHIPRREGFPEVGSPLPFGATSPTYIPAFAGKFLILVTFFKVTLCPASGADIVAAKVLL
jgi:hypothetical protein